MAIQIRRSAFQNPWGGESRPWEWGPSRVHGNGVIAMQYVPKGTSVGPTHVVEGAGWKMLHPLGNYNHSVSMENAVIIRHETFMEAVLVTDLYPGDEMLVDFRKQPEFEQPFPGWSE